MIGLIFTAIALGLAFARPNGFNEFYRAYLLGFMCWLGVALGSMAILMIRHLTGGGWGTVIRRILGAAMRTVPLLALLFIPIIFGIRHSISGPNRSAIFETSIFASISKISRRLISP